MVAKRALAQALQRGGRNGNVPVYSEELAEEICDRLATGESLYAICKDPHMPSEKAVRLWVETRPHTFGPKYARAREFGCDSLAEQVIAIGDGDFRGPDGWVDNGAVQAARLQAENRKWFLSKLMPKRYGEKVTQEITGEDGGALITRIELVPVAARPRAQIEHEQDATPALPRTRRPKKSG